MLPDPYAPQPPGGPAPTPDAALGRMKPGGVTGPSQAARAAYLEAQAQGKDGRQAAINAYKMGVADLSKRQAGPNYTPEGPGEANLKMITDHLVRQGQDPSVATAMAIEALAHQAQQAQQQRPPAGPGV